MGFDVAAFARRIRVLMAEKDMRKGELAKAVGVSGGLISQWLVGSTKPSVEHAVKIGRVFNRHPAFILFGVDCPAEELTTSKTTRKG